MQDSEALDENHDGKPSGASAVFPPAKGRESRSGRWSMIIA
jgi:hypothetical protein